MTRSRGAWVVVCALALGCHGHNGTSPSPDAATSDGGVDAGAGSDGAVTSSGGPLAIPTPALPTAIQQVAYSAALEATGGTPPYSWSIAGGAVPDGLTLDATSGAIAGLPSASARTRSFAVTVTDREALTQTKVFTVPVTSGGTCQGMTVSPGDHLASIVANAPAGTTFCLQTGVYPGVSVTPQAGDVFSSVHGTTTDNVVLEGATPLTSWSKVTIGAATYWTTPGGAALPSAQSSLQCDPETPGCYLSQDLFVGSSLYTHQIALAKVTAGAWYHEVYGITAAAVVAGGTGYAVGDRLDVKVGTDKTATVAVATITGTAKTGSVAMVKIATEGSGYPAGTSAATTSETGAGTGTGCTLSVTGGSGGVMNNVYLASSAQAPTDVELSTTPYAFMANVPNVTIQGLIIERYAPPLQSGVIRAGASAATAGSGSSSGWLIQNNELRYNHGGISFIRGADDWQVVNNYIHHDGTVGFGAGATVGGFFAGNTMAYGNQDHESCDFECVWKVTGGSSSCALANDLFIANNTIENNYGGGLWSDVCARYIVYDRNIVTSNVGEGIRVEVSDHNTITNNTLTNNTATAIVCTQCSTTTIAHNDITFVPPDMGSTGAIELSHSSTRDGEHVNVDMGSGFTVPVDVSITDNTVSVSDTTFLVKLSDSSPVVLSSWVTPAIFDRNLYCVGPAVSDWTGYTAWRFPTFSAAADPSTASVDFATWQADGQDPSGVLMAPGTCPRASSP